MNEIYIMDADGTNVEKLASGAMDNTSPSWSADGESIVYGGEGALGDEIRVVNADGTGERSITEPPTEGIDPAWLPSRKTERHRPPTEGPIRSACLEPEPGASRSHITSRCA